MTDTETRPASDGAAIALLRAALKRILVAQETMATGPAARAAYDTASDALAATVAWEGSDTVDPLGLAAIARADLGPAAEHAALEAAAQLVERPPDPRIVYGARCSWWDTIAHVGSTEGGLPVCPFCRRPLFEVPDEATWWAGVDEHAAGEGADDYRAFIEWLRGRCLPSLAAARSAYDAEIRS